MKKTSKLFAVAIVLVMMIALSAIPAAAFTYDPVAGGTTTFTTTLNNSGAPVPAWEATYTVAAGSGETSNGITTIAGPSPDAVVLKIDDTALTDGKVTFTAGGDATKTVTVDFSGVTFGQPGVYRYTLTQTATALPGMTLDEHPVRNIDLWVTDTGDALAVTTYQISHTAGKSTAFENGLGTQSLTISKTVSGLFASREKYFKFTVTISGLDAAATYNITVAEPAPATNATTTYDTMTNPATATGAQLTAGVDFYLQHGQSVVIAGLPYGAEYTVVEASEEYTSNQTYDTVSGSIAAEAVTAAFINTKDGEVPTGVILAVVPGAALLAAGVVGLVVMSRKRKNEDEEE